MFVVPPCPWCLVSPRALPIVEGKLKDGSVEDYWDTFKAIMLDLQDEFIPLVTVGPDSKPKWMDKNVVMALKDKKRAWNKYLFCRSVNNFETYKLLRNKLKSVILEPRRNMEKKIALEVKTRPKSFWNYSARKTKPSDTMGQVRNKNGVLTQSNEETASCLNNYFASVFTRDKENETMPDFQNRYGSILADIPIEERAIKKLLNDIKVDKAMGTDGISPRTLWETRGFISEALAEMFKASLKQGRIPSDWKKAIIVPIYKKGRRDMHENYRPVSLTCVISKVMEKIIRDALVSFCIDNGILSERQFGFVPGRSCTVTLQLFVCVEECSRSIDDGKQIDVIYTDYSRAFDTVSHRKLMHKLHGLGVQGKMWTWIQEFLSDRKQKVRVNDGFSGWERVVSGVPQGSENLATKTWIPSLQYKRMRADMLQVYKILHGIERINPDVFFEWADGTRTRGHKYKIIKQRCSTSFRLHSFSHRVVDTWNALPEHVVDSPNVNIFKTRLNTVWKNHPNKFAPSFYS